MTNLDNNETIKPAIDDITPADGAKERMLVNIKRKAQKPEPIAAGLAKWTAPLAACIAVAVIAAAGAKIIPAQTTSRITSEPVRSESPVRLVDSAEAFSEELGISVDAPKGSGNVQYMIIYDKTAEISFMYNDIDYSLRASKQGGDFSGIYGTAVLSEQIGGENEAMLTAVKNSSNETYLKLKWNNGKTQYILSCADSEAGSYSPNIKNSGSYSRTKAAGNIIELYELLK